MGLLAIDIAGRYERRGGEMDSMGEDAELKEYIGVFTLSSDRVRRLILISVVASILIFAAFWNSRRNTWWVHRSVAIRTAVRNEIWRPDIKQRLEVCKIKGPGAAGLYDDCAKVEELFAQLDSMKHGEASLKAHLAELEAVRVSNIQWISVPFLGINFDINDLGAFSAVALSIVSFVLVFSMARQHENLYLSLWKIRQIVDREKKPDDGQSRANFLYHSLAMAQVFTRPPTLARWRPHRVGPIAVRSLFFVPIATQLFVWIHDVRTIKHAWGMNPLATIGTMSVQTFFLGVILICGFTSCIYSRAGDLRWRETFSKINPARAAMRQPSWWKWMKVGLLFDHQGGQDR